MPNYATGKIYRLISKQTDDVYYGSTCSTLAQRLAEHRYAFRHPEERLQCSSKELVKYTDVKIRLVEDFPCERREQLVAREQHFIDLNTCVNKHTAFGVRGAVQYERTDNSKENFKRWSATPFTCECGSTVRTDYALKHEKTLKHQRWVAKQTAT
jgi:hypothetical protein